MVLRGELIECCNSLLRVCTWVRPAEIGGGVRGGDAEKVVSLEEGTSDEMSGQLGRREQVLQRQRDGVRCEGGRSGH